MFNKKSKKLQKTIEKSGLFDKVFYLKTYRDVRLADMTPIEHYATIGIKEDRKPNATFDPVWYREYYQDVKADGAYPLVHYILFGKKENRFQNEMEKDTFNVEPSEALSMEEKQLSKSPINGFDEKSYLEVNLDMQYAVEEGIAASCLDHPQNFGLKEIEAGRRQFHKDFEPYDEVKYLELNSDVAEAIERGYYMSGFEHFCINGYSDIIKQDREWASLEPPVVATENENKAIVFDTTFYLENNIDVKETGIDAEWHYYSNGENEGRCPNSFFDPVFYNRLNADVRAAKISPFQHYISNGFYEGRLGSSPQNKSRKTSKTNKPLLFVGHDGIQAGSEVVLLEVVKWYYFHTNRKIKLLLLSPGPVADQYAYYADVYVLPNYTVDDEKALRLFLNESFEFIYLNTVVTGRLFQLIKGYDIHLKGDIITHIHEMEKVIAEHETEMQELLLHTKIWISASPASSKTLIEKYQLPENKVITVPAFINPIAINQEKNLFQVEARIALDLSEDAFVVTGCGTVYWRKGADLFIEAARHIKANTDKKCEFIWIGDGPDKEELINQLTEEECHYIKFVGNRTDANKMLAAADVFFLSSREDPFPLVVLESAQHNIPTVCFEPATGITAFIKKDAGISVEDIDPILAANAILRLIDDPEQILSLGNVARERLFSIYTTGQQNIKIFETIKEHTSYMPSVSVIIPFYNHEKFIEERIDSVLRQSIKDVEIILLDDYSSDNTVEKIMPYLKDSRISLVKNESNSGSPFNQWAKGIALARGNIIWIAEGDDSCDNNLLETLLPYFDDPMVNISAAKTEIINEDGKLKENVLDPYLNSAYYGKFDQSYKKDGFIEVEEQFGAMCTLVNASALLIRKKSFGPMLKKANTFKMVGDWLIYLDCLKGGKIAYSVDTHNYFRRHSASAVHKVEGTEIYFKEREAVTKFVFENFEVSHRLVRKAFQAIDHEWERFKYKHPDKTLNDLYHKKSLTKDMAEASSSPHIAFYVHGIMFSQGGIERLAADLANHLAEKKWKITIFCRSWGNQDYTVYPLYETVSVVPIFNEHKQEETVADLRKALQNSDIDVFVPMLSEWLFEPIVSAAEGTGIPIIASEHNDPWKIEALWWDHDKRVSCFEKVDNIHLLLNKFSDSLPGSLATKIRIIPNGVITQKSLPSDKREKLIIGVGRLVEQKRFDRLVEASALIQEKLREENWKVKIYGEGLLVGDLEDQISQAEIDDIVELCGNTNEIDKVYSKASIFVMSSAFEGFGIALVEAMSYGLPAIGFKECNGPNEIIRNEKDGYLVEDIQDLASKLLKLMAMEKKEFNAKRQSAFERAGEYSMDLFYQKWENILLEAVKNLRN